MLWNNIWVILQENLKTSNRRLKTKTQQWRQKTTQQKKASTSNFSFLTTKPWQATKPVHNSILWSMHLYILLYETRKKERTSAKLWLQNCWLCTLRVITVLFDRYADMGDDYWFLPLSAVISLTKLLKTLGLTSASEIVNGKNANWLWRRTEPLKTYIVQVTGILVKVLWWSYQIKTPLEMQSCSAAINLKFIKWRRDSPAGKVWTTASVSCLQEESLNKGSTNMLIYLNCGINVLFCLSPLNTWKL